MKLHKSGAYYSMKRYLFIAFKFVVHLNPPYKRPRRNDHLDITAAYFG